MIFAVRREPSVYLRKLFEDRILVERRNDVLSCDWCTRLLYTVGVAFDKHNEHTERGKYGRVQTREQGDSECREENKNYGWDTCRWCVYVELFLHSLFIRPFIIHGSVCYGNCVCFHRLKNFLYMLYGNIKDRRNLYSIIQLN